MIGDVGKIFGTLASPSTRAYEDNVLEY